MEVDYFSVPRKQLVIIDKVVEKLKDNKTGVVESPSDWEAIVLLFELFSVDHPEHYAHFVELMKKYRSATTFNNSIVDDGQGDKVQHMLEIPEMFYNYIYKMFPNQKWDRKFLNKLAKELPILKMSDNL
jgi:hypothetical protein